MRVLRDKKQDEFAIFAMIEVAANNGEPCPSNRSICDRLGMKSLSGPTDAIRRLERRGLIKVERFNRSRRVTVLATGKQTYAKSKSAHWTERSDAKMAVRKAHSRHKEDPVVPMEPSANRSPCFHCGVRGDIGCKCRAVLYG